MQGEAEQGNSEEDSNDQLNMEEKSRFVVLFISKQCSFGLFRRSIGNLKLKATVQDIDIKTAYFYSFRSQLGFKTIATEKRMGDTNLAATQGPVQGHRLRSQLA